MPLSLISHSALKFVRAIHIAAFSRAGGNCDVRCNDAGATLPSLFSGNRSAGDPLPDSWPGLASGCIRLAERLWMQVNAASHMMSPVSNIANAVAQQASFNVFQPNRCHVSRSKGVPLSQHYPCWGIAPPAELQSI
jgi:hypothetical protein